LKTGRKNYMAPRAPADAAAVADSHMAQARHKVSLAALGCLRGATDAPALVRSALSEIDRARAVLAKSGEK
jgi:uncharacterized protein (DUF1810 family)